MKKLIYLISIFLILLSCDQIDDPYAQGIIDNGGGEEVPDSLARNALLIEFTAIKCRNCPEASARAQDLIDANKGRVFGLNVHSGILAVANGDQPDFRNKYSDELYLLAKNPPQPTGMVNFIPNGTAANLANSLEWEQIIQQELNKKASMRIELEVQEVSTNNYNLIAKMIYLEDPDENDQLAIYLTENGIIGYQLNIETQIDDYEHNHVLRKAVLGTLGESIYDPNLSAGDTLTREIPIEIEDEWVAENISVIAFVYDFEDTFEIQQVNEIYLVSNE